jgi:hypothetical protein
MQIGMLRDYLDLEFKSAYGKEWPFPYCLERLIDDFVLLCMLVCVVPQLCPSSLEPLLNVVGMRRRELPASLWNLSAPACLDCTSAGGLKLT